MKRMLPLTVAMALLALSLTAGTNALAQDAPAFVLSPYDGLTQYFYETHGRSGYILEEGQFSKEDIHTYSYESDTVFKGAQELAAGVLEAGKNPGLGVRGLHAQGITGKGVNVAVIDQPLLVDHPEFAGRIAMYYDSGCETPEGEGTHHGPSVTSLLAGETVGVAPEANVYFAAAPAWHQDSAYFADCLRWIIEQNEALPEEDKIRLVSVSSAPEEGWYTNAPLWDEAVEAATQAGILILDCRSQAADTGFVFSAYYDPASPEDVTLCRPGYPNEAYDDFTGEYWEGTIFAPASYRTMAREYAAGDPRYGYDGLGGQSWSVPYVAGVLALGFQLRPDLSGEEMKALLFESCWVDQDGLRFVDPVRFVQAVQEAG